jgi:hypothetical protein
MADRLAVLKKEISRLDDHEQKLDMHKQVCYVNQINIVSFTGFTMMVTRCSSVCSQTPDVEQLGVVVTL